MQELQSIADILKALGVSSLFGPLFALFIMVWFLKKSVFAGTGQILTSFVKEYLSQQRDHIQISTEVDVKLGQLAQDIKSFTMELIKQEERAIRERQDMRTAFDARLNTIEYCFAEHISQFHDLARELGHPRKPSYEMDTETFRKNREKERQTPQPT